MTPITVTRLMPAFAARVCSKSSRWSKYSRQVCGCLRSCPSQNPPGSSSEQMPAVAISA